MTHECGPTCEHHSDIQYPNTEYLVEWQDDTWVAAELPQPVWVNESLAITRDSIEENAVALALRGRVGEKAKGHLQGEIERIVDDVKNRRLSPAGAAADFEAAAREAARRAYRSGNKGVGRTPSPEETEEVAEEYAAKQSGYFRRWLDQLTGRLSPSKFPEGKRVSMYAASLHHVFTRGALRGMPDAWCEWKLGPVGTEHCPDCVALAAGSPYKVGQLPTWPGTGDTQCFTACRCGIIVISKWQAARLRLARDEGNEPEERRHRRKMTHVELRAQVKLTEALVCKPQHSASHSANGGCCG